MIVVGIVLAAGSSTRLGRPKQTLSLGTTTVLGRSVSEAISSTLDRVCVVLGAGAAGAREVIPPGTRAEVVLNDEYGTGCASSLLAGLHAAGDCAAIMLLLGDMPGVDAAVIDTVLADWQATQSWAAVTAYRDGVGHPFVFSAGAYPALRGLQGDKAVWKIVDREPESRVARIPVDRPLPLDIDTWDDYLEVCSRLGVAPASNC